MYFLSLILYVLMGVVTIVPLLFPTLFGKRVIFTCSPLLWVFVPLSFHCYHVCLPKLSVNDVIVSQKGSNVNVNLQFYGWDYNFTHTLCAKLHLCAKILTLDALKYCSKWVFALMLIKRAIKMNRRKYAPLHEKGTKQKQKSAMDTTL